MIPKQVTLRNFMTFAEQVDIVFDDDEPLWVIAGPNGIGKSAIFDAITYCLFGCHRGGKQNHDQMIRHNCDGFSLVFVFEFNRQTYKIARNRNRKKSSQSLEREIEPGKWLRVPNVNSDAQLDQWVIDTLGMKFEAFEASVLLRQGNSDVILTAPPVKRLELLKSIIGLEQYEKLSASIHHAKLQLDSKLSVLANQRDGVREVTPAQLELAQNAEIQADAEYLTAEQQEAIAKQTLDITRDWLRLKDQRDGLQRKLDEANLRSASSHEVRCKYDRYLNLKTLLPNLEKMADARRQFQVSDKQRNQFKHTSDSSAEFYAASNQQYQDLLVTSTAFERERDQQRANYLETHKRVDELLQHEKLVTDLVLYQQRYESYPATLLVDHELSNQQRLSLQHRLQDLREELAGARAELDQAKRQQQRFAQLEIGVSCSSCGQLVTAEHAERERTNADRTLLGCKEKVDRLTEGVRTQTALAAEAETALIELGKHCEAWRTDEQRYHDHRRMLERLGIVADLNLLTEQLAAERVAHTQAEKLMTAASLEIAILKPRLETLKHDSLAAEQSMEQARREHQDIEKKWQLADATLQALLTQVAPEWENSTDDMIHQMRTEYDQLDPNTIIQQMDQLKKDELYIQQYREQLENLTQEIESVPSSARCDLSMIEQQLDQLSAITQQARRTAQQLRETAQRLADDERRYRDLVEGIRTVEINQRHHRKLDDMLGKTGLQRHLVRHAEKSIVAIATETAQQLSDGDLSISLDESDRSDDKALSLMVRRSDSSKPIPVAFLSGSQKFRIAISLALAIGRYASGQARPLESVIIDEGFGSLDKDGLRAAAEELNRLKTNLRRIILVSHQDEFTDHFPVMIRLSSESGCTIATKVRRSES